MQQQGLKRGPKVDLLPPCNQRVASQTALTLRVAWGGATEANPWYHTENARTLAGKLATPRIKTPGALEMTLVTFTPGSNAMR